MDQRQRKIEEYNKQSRRHAFWSRPEHWPFDAPEHVFIPRALINLGRQAQPDWPTEDRDVWKTKAFQTVAMSFREHCAFGRLTAFVQHYDGQFRPIPPEAWNTRDFEDWFVDFTAPASVTGDYRHSLSKPPQCPLFIGRPELQQIVSGSSTNMAHPGEDEYVPPYMRLMLVVYREQGMSRANQLTIDALASALVEASKRPGFPILSPTLARKAATLMREPESQSGTASFYERRKSKDG